MGLPCLYAASVWRVSYLTRKVKDEVCPVGYLREGMTVAKTLYGETANAFSFVE